MRLSAQVPERGDCFRPGYLTFRRPPQVMPPTHCVSKAGGAKKSPKPCWEYALLAEVAEREYALLGLCAGKDAVVQRMCEGIYLPATQMLRVSAGSDLEKE